MSKSILLDHGFTGFVAAGMGAAKAGSEQLTQAKIAEIRRDAVAECDRRFEAERAEYRRRLGESWRSFEANFSKFQAGIEQTIKDQFIETSVRIAEVILRSRLPDRDMLIEVIKKTLEPLTDLQGVRIRMSPDDARAVIAAREDGGRKEVADAVEIVEDASLGAGDVLIESRNGYFNAQISERLEILKQLLKERSRDAHSDNA